MAKKDFADISIRGRVAYAIMCFERYALAKYPQNDFTPVCEMMWDIVSDKDYIDASAERFMEIVPEYLYEFDDFEEAGFEFLSRSEFVSMRALIPRDDDKLDAIMRSVYDTATVHAYSAIKAYGKESVDCMFEAVTALKAGGVEPPDPNAVAGLSFAESGGWGSFVSHEGLSVVLE